MSKQITCRARLVADFTDMMGYTTYVFENLDYDSWENHYIMCVRYPNWNQAPFDLYEEGYLNAKFVEAGVDKWFDGTNFIPYRYTDIAFLKFVKEPTKIDNTAITVD